jgi:type I restriction enzyme S subunit
MSSLSSWTKKPLGAILDDIGDGGTPDTNKKEYFGGSIPWVVIQDIKNEISDTRTKITKMGLDSCSAKLWPAETIILSTGATIGEVGLAQIPLATKQGIHGLVCKTEIDSKFLFYKIQTLRDYLKANAQGSTIREVRAPFLKTIDIEFPCSKPEQSKIAEVLSTVDRAIEQTEGVIAKQQRIKTGLMQDLLTRGIDEHGNLRSEEIHEFKDSPIGRIPVDWDMQALGELSQISSGITLGKTHAGSNTIELPYLRVANVQDSFLDLSDVRTIRVPTSYVEKYQLHVGDVLMNEGGDFDKLGRGAVWHGEIDICLHQNHVFKVRPKEGKLSSNFLANVSASPYGKAFFVLASKQSTNLASINSTQLKGFLVPLPSYREQIEIEKIISGNEETIKIYQAELNKFLYFKRALMQDLLTGKVRVTPLLEKKETTP